MGLVSPNVNERKLDPRRNQNLRISPGGWSGLELTDTLEGDLIVEIIKVKPGLYISRKDRKHMVATMFF